MSVGPETMTLRELLDSLPLREGAGAAGTAGQLEVYAMDGTTGDLYPIVLVHAEDPLARNGVNRIVLELGGGP